MEDGKEKKMKEYELSVELDNYVALAGALVNSEVYRYLMACINKELGNERYPLAAKTGGNAITKDEIDFARVYFHSPKFNNFSMSLLDPDDMLRTIESNGKAVANLIKALKKKLNREEMKIFIKILQNEFLKEKQK